MITPQSNKIDDIEHLYFEYYPSNFVLEVNPALIGCNPQTIRNIAWDFKEGKDQNWPLILVEQTIKNKLPSLPITNRDNLTLVCPPASKISTNNQRFLRFTYDLCHSLKMQNGFDHIKIINEKEPKHQYNTPAGAKTTWDMAQDLEFTPGFFEGKDVILFDDIVTTGDTMRDFIKKMKELGANPLLCLSLLYTPKIF